MLGRAHAVDLRLFVRKHLDDRGHVLTHASGRVLVLVGNSPALWVYAFAYHGVACTLDGVRTLLGADEIPVGIIFKGAERAHARSRRARRGGDGGSGLEARTRPAGWAAYGGDDDRTPDRDT